MRILHKNVTSWPGSSYLDLNAAGHQGLAHLKAEVLGFMPPTGDWLAPTSLSPFSDMVIEILKWMKHDKFENAFDKVNKYTRKRRKTTSAPLLSQLLRQAWDCTRNFSFCTTLFLLRTRRAVQRARTAPVLCPEDGTGEGR